MQVESGEENDDSDPATLAPGDLLSWSCSHDGVSLLLGNLWVFSKDWQPILCASSQLHGHFGGKLADHKVELGQQGGAVLVMMAVGSMGSGWGVCEYGDGVCLLPDTLWFFFTDWQLIFRAYLQSLGHFGRLVAVHDKELGRQGEAVPLMGAVGNKGLEVCE